MKRWLGKAWPIVLLWNLSACIGGEEAAQGPNGSGPWIVALTADYLDVYGPIKVTIEGHEPFVLEEANEYTCETSPLLVDRADFTLEAISERFFYWAQGARSEADGCITVSLDVDNLDSGLIVYYRGDYSPTPCIPAEYFIRVNGVEASIGRIEVPAVWDTDIYEDYNVQIQQTFLMAMEGKIALAGGEKGDVPFELRIDEHEGCPNEDRDWSWAGYTPPRGIWIGSGYEAGWPP